MGGGGGKGANKQEPLTSRGFPEGNSPPENFEILKLGNANFPPVSFLLLCFMSFFPLLLLHGQSP